MSVVVTLAHCRELGYCTSGMRDFCARHGLDWAALRSSGLPVEVVENTGDAMALKAAELARREQGQ